LLFEYGDESRIAQLEQDAGPVRTVLLKVASALGAVRYANRVSPTPVKLDKFSVRRFVDRDLKVQWAEIEYFVVSEGMYPSALEFREVVRLMPSARLEDIAQGHDLIDVLTLALERLIGSSKPGAARVESGLRMGVKYHEVSGWALWGSIKSFELKPEREYLIA
jgi:hypothetical protein